MMKKNVYKMVANVRSDENMVWINHVVPFLNLKLIAAFI